MLDVTGIHLYGFRQHDAVRFRSSSRLPTGNFGRKRFGRKRGIGAPDKPSAKRDEEERRYETESWVDHLASNSVVNTNPIG